MNKQLIENIKLKSDLQYDLLFESSYYSTLDDNTKLFIKENYNRGVNLGLEILENNPHLISESNDENIDEAWLDRLKATGARAIQGVKNVTGIGTQTADSKDAGIDSLFNSFKSKFDKTPGGAAAAAAPAPQQQGGADQGGNKVVQKTGKEIEDLDNETKNLPPIPPQQAAQMVQKANVPKSFKDKLMTAIRNNPGKTRLIIGGLSMAAGAAGTLVGVPPNISGAIVNGIGSAIVNKAQGKSAMAGLVQGGLSGLALGSMGAGISDFIANGMTNLGTQAVAQAAASKAAGSSFTPTDAGETDALQASNNYTPMEPGDPGYTDPNVAPEDLRGTGGYDPNTDTNHYDDKGNRIPDSPEDLRGTGGYDPNTDTNQYDAQGNRIPDTGATTTSGAYPFAQTDPNKLYPDTGATTNQAFPGTRPEDIVPGSANDPNQGMYTTAASAAKKIPRPNYTKGAELLQRGFRKENLEKTFIKSYNNTYVLNKKSNIISENEVEEIDETWKENINEALTDEQNALLKDFIKDLSIKLRQSPQTVIQFMKSQGDRFKHIIDYLPSEVGGNRNMGAQPGQPGQPGQPQQGQPGQPQQGQPGQPQQGQPGQPQQGQLITGPVPGDAAAASPQLMKNIAALKSSKLFAGNLEGRIAGLLNVKYEVPAERTKFDALLKSLNGIINAQSANVKKRLGDPNAILTTLKEAEIKDYLSLGQDISAVMPSILNTAFLLRQAFSKKNPNAVAQKQPQAGDVGFNRSAPHTLPKGVQPGQVNEQLKISVQELTTIKYFLSQLIQVGNLVKNTNVQDPAQLKNLFRGILTLANIVSNKNVKGVKLNNKVDVGFQGKDILGAGAADKPEKQVKKGPGDMFKQGKDSEKNDIKHSNMDTAGGNPDQRGSDKDNPELEESKIFIKESKHIFKLK